jgi:hypothetical protein
MNSRRFYSGIALGLVLGAGCQVARVPTADSRPQPGPQPNETTSAVQPSDAVAVVEPGPGAATVAPKPEAAKPDVVVAVSVAQEPKSLPAAAEPVVPVTVKPAVAEASAKPGATIAPAMFVPEPKANVIQVTARVPEPAMGKAQIGFPVDVSLKQGPRDEVPRTVSVRATPTPAPAVCGHADDYTWLTGEIQYIHTHNAWHLRYAPADEKDRHGGCVTLSGDLVAAGCQSGQVVRVEGYLLNPDSSEVRPPFWVNRLTLVKPAAAMPQ